jgi:hypothetical protein
MNSRAAHDIVREHSVNQIDAHGTWVGVCLATLVCIRHLALLQEALHGTNTDPKSTLSSVGVRVEMALLIARSPLEERADVGRGVYVRSVSPL